MGRRVHTRVFGGLVALVVLAPLPLGSNRPWAWFLLAASVGALLALWFGGIALAGHPQPLPARRLRVPLLLFACVCAWILVQWAPWTPARWHHPLWADAGGALAAHPAGRISVNPERTLQALVRLLSYGGVFWLALQLGRSGERARRGLRAVVYAGVLYALYGLFVQFSGSEKILWMDRWAYAGVVTSTFVNRNSYATYAGLGLVCACALFLRKVAGALGAELPARAKMRLWLEQLLGPAAPLLVALLVLATALLLTESRGGTLSALFGLLALLAASLFGGVVSRRQASAAGLLLLLAGALVFSMSGGNLGERLRETGSEELTRGGRAAVYAIVVRAIADAPLLGTGYGSFPDVFPLYRDASVEDLDVWERAHNTYLESALELGIPAAVALWSAVLCCAGRCWCGIRLRRRGRVYPSIGVAATALVAVHSTVDFSLQIPAIAVTYAFLLGIGCAQSWPTDA